MLCWNEKFKSLFITGDLWILSLKSTMLVKMVNYWEREVSMEKHRLVREALAESQLDGRRCSRTGQIKAILDSCRISGEWSCGYGRDREAGEVSKQVHST